MKKPKHMYIISKKVIATSMKDAMKKELEAEVIAISLEQENICENPIGFKEK